ncbi:MAG TPA: transcriptional regulator [Silvibacterium sp.]|nr:transcriptional regulator [Silvibacterium sp.]
MSKQRLSSLLLGLATLVVFCPAAANAASSRWITVGPDGGDARAFASSPADPHHLYLGTTNSWIYQSMDDGATWTRLAQVGTVDDLVIDNLVVDEANPRTLYAGVWQLDHEDGGVYVSHDGGRTWASSPEMQGQSVRALTQSSSNPRILVAGAIGGVFRTEDSGRHWRQISPQGSGEIHKVESIAIDPTDPHIIYAGTWHLPWKTTDGGATWHNLKQGLIDDSDVFSIILDPKNPSTVYLSACSGIYKSETGGEQFRKIQGIPSTARRTRVLMQDPANLNVVYAGTTEGLYKTEDAGTKWVRMTGPDVIINDVYVNPRTPQRVLLATDRSGVLASNDSGARFESSNRGMSERQVTALLADSHHADTLYAGVVNDKSYGGVFVSQDGGTSWTQHSAGLDGRDVFSLSQAENGAVYAGTSHGLFRWNGERWEPANRVVNVKEKTVYVVRHHKKVKRTIAEGSKESTIASQVNDLSVNGPVWFAATSEGVYRSTTHGATWTGPVIDEAGYRFVDAHDGVVIAARRTDLRISQDGGEHWNSAPMPGRLTSVSSVAATPAGVLWVGGREGAFYSSDNGQTWHSLPLPVSGIDSVNYDAGLGRVLIASTQSDMIFAVNPDDSTWKWWNAGWKVRMIHSLNGRLVGATLYDGVVVQPQPDGRENSEQAFR